VPRHKIYALSYEAGVALLAQRDIRAGTSALCPNTGKYHAAHPPRPLLQPNRILGRNRRFYTELLDLSTGPRPNFPFRRVAGSRGRGGRAYGGNRPHRPEGLKRYLGDKGMDSVPGTGTIDHIALTGRDVEGMRAHFREVCIPYRDRTVPRVVQPWPVI
jgi:hypothetical protein